MWPNWDDGWRAGAGDARMVEAATNDTGAAKNTG
jgi:hypothetical protein